MFGILTNQTHSARIESVAKKYRFSNRLLVVTLLLYDIDI